MSRLPFEKERKNIIIKKEGTIDPNLGQEPNERSIEELIQYGIVNIDKP